MDHNITRDTHTQCKPRTRACSRCGLVARVDNFDRKKGEIAENAENSIVRRSKHGGASFSKGENSRGGDFCLSSEKEQQLLANKCTHLWSCDSALFGLLASVLYSARCFLLRSVARCLALSPLVSSSSSVT